MQNITHVIIGLDVGGAERSLQKLIRGSKLCHHNVISLTSIGKVGQELLAEGVDVTALGLSKINIFWVAFRLFKIIRSQPPQVLQTWMYHADLIGGLIARFAGCKNVVWNIRNTEVPQRYLSITTLLIRLCAVLSHVVPKVVVSCSRAGKECHESLGYSRKKITVITNGFEESLNDSDAKKDDEEDFFCDIQEKNCPIIGVVGRFDRLKGYDIFFDALSQLLQANKKFKVIMIGRGLTRDNESFASLIPEKMTKRELLLTGESDNVASLLSKCDFLCLPSRAEGFPNVVGEAMMLELPCVVTNVGDAAYIVGDTGYVVNPENSSDLANALSKMIAIGADERVVLGRRAKLRIVENFNQLGVVKNYEDLYLKLSIL